MEKLKEEIVPTQEEGGSSDTIASCSCVDGRQARSFFRTVKDRLLNVNDWSRIAGPASADFKLCDEKGNEVNRQPKPKDHFKIDVPGPGPVSGDGYDWVQIESIEEKSSDESEMIAITVRPATNPANENKDVAHFFSDAASSSFIIERKENVVSAGVFGRNEKFNAEAESIMDKARNSAMAFAAITAFSKIQWKGLVDGLIKQGN